VTNEPVVGTRSYVTQTQAGNLPEPGINPLFADTVKSWTFKWTAPPAATAPKWVTFWFCGVAGNNKDAQAGDKAYQGMLRVAKQ